jgi:hypothetical protein
MTFTFEFPDEVVETMAEAFIVTFGASKGFDPKGENPLDFTRRCCLDYVRSVTIDHCQRKATIEAQAQIDAAVSPIRESLSQVV